MDENAAIHPLAETGSWLSQSLPTLLGGLAVLVVGVLAAWLAYRAVVRVMLWLRLDRLAQRGRFGTALPRGDVRHTFFRLVGWMVGGLVFLVFLNRAADAWRLTVLTHLIERLVDLLPSLVAAGLILLVGTFLAGTASRAVRAALLREGVSHAALVSSLVRAGVLILAWAIALVQVGVAPILVMLAFGLTAGGISLAFVLAFGLGSRRAVERFWEGLAERGKSREPDGPKDSKEA